MMILILMILILKIILILIMILILMIILILMVILILRIYNNKVLIDIEPATSILLFFMNFIISSSRFCNRAPFLSKYRNC